MTTRIVPEELVELDRPFAEFFRTLAGPWPFRPLMALTPGNHFIPVSVPKTPKVEGQPKAKEIPVKYPKPILP